MNNSNNSGGDGEDNSDIDGISFFLFLQCNNPMTKEAKLVAAQRIISEWNEYDTEMKNVMQGIRLSKTSQTQGEWMDEA